MTEMTQEIQNNFESKVSCKIETNSSGYNTTVHVYQGAKKAEIDDTIAKTVYAHEQLQKRLTPSLKENGDIEIK